MDHFRCIVDTVNQRTLQIPYLGDIVPSLEYHVESDSFETYLDRVGIDPRRLAAGYETGKTQIETLCFVQSWCFFGLLFTGIRACRFDAGIDDFTQTTHIQSEDPLESQCIRVVKTSALPHLLRRMEEASRPENCSADTQRVMYEELIDVLATLSAFIVDCNTLASRNSNGPNLRVDAEARSHVPSLRDKIMLSVMALGEYFYYIVLKLLLPEDVMPLELSFGKCDWLGFLKPSMNKMGWCNSEINIMDEQQAGISTLYALSEVDRHYVGRDHSNCGDNLLCKYEKLDTKNYEPDHTFQCNRTTCHDIVMREELREDLISLVMKNETPVLTIEPVDSTNTKVSVRSAQQINQPYVCISHVWQDRMGNPHVNALPSCKVRQLQEWVNELYDAQEGQVPFWIDTLCVPLDQPYRRAAITRMFSVYKDASAVIVIEAHLLARSTLTDDPKLLLMTIRSCNWMRRLWTFQEGVLAQKLYFRFSDCALDLNDILSFTLKESQDWDSIEWKGWTYSRDYDAADERLAESDCLLMPTWNWISRLTDLNFEQEEPMSLQQRLDAFFLLLCWRNTSWKIDEPFCYSLILGMEVKIQKEIAQLESLEERMELLFRNIDLVPANILFVHGDRLKTHGFTWAPKSFIGGGRQATMLSIGPGNFGKVTNVGLMLTATGFLLKGEVPYADAFFVENYGGIGFTLVPKEGYDLDLERLKGSSLALILKTPLDLSANARLDQTSMAALVEVTDEANLCVSYLQCVELFVEEEPPTDRKENVIALAKMFNSAQLWIVQ